MLSFIFFRRSLLIKKHSQSPVKLFSSGSNSDLHNSLSARLFLCPSTLFRGYKAKTAKGAPKRRQQTRGRPQETAALTPQTTPASPCPGGQVTWHPGSKIGPRPTSPKLGGGGWAGPPQATPCEKGHILTPLSRHGAQRAHPNAPRDINERKAHATLRPSPHFDRPQLGSGHSARGGPR